MRGSDGSQGYGSGRRWSRQQWRLGQPVVGRSHGYPGATIGGPGQLPGGGDRTGGGVSNVGNGGQERDGAAASTTMATAAAS